jgi:hypothetical protein
MQNITNLEWPLEWQPASPGPKQKETEEGERNVPNICHSLRQSRLGHLSPPGCTGGLQLREAKATNTAEPCALMLKCSTQRVQEPEAATYGGTRQEAGSIWCRLHQPLVSGYTNDLYAASIQLP